MAALPLPIFCCRLKPIAAGCRCAALISSESTALGVALLAGLSAGCLSDLNAARQVRAAGSRRFDPALNKAERERWLKRWDSAVHRCLEWHGDALR